MPLVFSAVGLSTIPQLVLKGFTNVMGFSSKKLPYIFLTMFIDIVIKNKPFLVNLHSNIQNLLVTQKISLFCMWVSMIFRLFQMRRRRKKNKK
jgi:hypothetical protein